MNGLWSGLSFGIILLLAVIVYIQYLANRQRSRQLRYIKDKLNAIMNGATTEKLMLVTDDKELKELLTAANRLLESTQESQAGFAKTELSLRKMLANISHDLKTPLTVVLGYIETIVHDPGLTVQEKERLLAKVEAKAKELLELINLFFDLAKLESGDMDLPLERVQMNEICRTNLLFFYDRIQAQDMEVAITIPESPIYALGNEEALNRILHNLLSNAIQYGADGRVVGITLRAEEHHVVIEVWDRGRGIQEKHQDLIFERMYTLDDSRNRAYQGSGLGLTITKRLSEQLQGELELNSKPYEKTVFSLKLKRVRE